jgi:hypothetical protein
MVKTKRSYPLAYKCLMRVNNLLQAMSLAAAYRKIGLKSPYKTPDFGQPTDDASVQQKYPVLVSSCPVVGHFPCPHRVSFSWGWITVYSVTRPKFGKLQPSGKQ